MPISVLVDQSTRTDVQDLVWCDATEYPYLCPGDRVAVEDPRDNATVSATVLTVERVTVPSRARRISSVLWLRSVDDPEASIDYHACVSVTGLRTPLLRWCTIDHRMFSVRIGTGVQIGNTRTGTVNSGTVITLGRATERVSHAITAVMFDARTDPRNAIPAVDVRLDSGGFGTFDGRGVPGWQFQEGDRVTVSIGGAESYGTVVAWRPVESIRASMVVTAARNDGRAADVPGVEIRFCEVVFSNAGDGSDQTYLYSTGRFRDVAVGDRVIVETRRGEAPARVVSILTARPENGYQGPLKRVVSVPPREYRDQLVTCARCHVEFGQSLQACPNCGFQAAQARRPANNPGHVNCRCVIDPKHSGIEPLKTKRRILP